MTSSTTATASASGTGKVAKAVLAGIACVALLQACDGGEGGSGSGYGSDYQPYVNPYSTQRYGSGGAGYYVGSGDTMAEATKARRRASKADAETRSILRGE